MKCEQEKLKFNSLNMSDEENEEEEDDQQQWQQKVDEDDDDELNIYTDDKCITCLKTFKVYRSNCQCQGSVRINQPHRMQNSAKTPPHHFSNSNMYNRTSPIYYSTSTTASSMTQGNRALHLNYEINRSTGQQKCCGSTIHRDKNSNYIEPKRRPLLKTDRIEGDYNNITGRHKEDIGQLSYFPSLLLGEGCEGTTVYRGLFRGPHSVRDVAVKTMLRTKKVLAQKEVDMLVKSEYHPYVIRYIHMETDKFFIYLALELCHSTLHHLVEGSFKLQGDTTLKQLLKQTLCGVSHLHALNIVHRDLKPRNILLWKSQTGQVFAKVSDFDRSKEMRPDHNSMSLSTGGKGTVGWMAPEYLEIIHNKKTLKTLTFEADVFSLGCIIYYTLTNGEHPFGPEIDRNSNIYRGESDLKHLSDGDVKDLVKLMTSHDPQARPTAAKISIHSAFGDVVVSSHPNSKHLPGTSPGDLSLEAAARLQDLSTAPRKQQLHRQNAVDHPIISVTNNFNIVSSTIVTNNLHVNKVDEISVGSLTSAKFDKIDEANVNKMTNFAGGNINYTSTAGKESDNQSDSD